MNEKLNLKIEAAVFRSLRNHLQKRTDVQNIDMMNMTGFCRNCLGRWYREAPSEMGVEMGKEESLETIYGMPVAEWKEKYQIEATDTQKKEFKAIHE